MSVASMDEQLDTSGQIAPQDTASIKAERSLQIPPNRPPEQSTPDPKGGNSDRSHQDHFNTAVTSGTQPKGVAQDATHNYYQEEDFMMNLATSSLGPPHQQLQPSQQQQLQQQQRYQRGMSPEGMQPAMHRMTPRALFPEDEMGGGMYPPSGQAGRDQGARFARLAMQPPVGQADQRPGMAPQISSSPGVGPMTPSSHMHTPHSADGSPAVAAAHPSEEYRDVGRVQASPMDPGRLQRSSSEGLMRTRSSMRTHQRTVSASGLQEEQRAPQRVGADQPPGLLFPRNLDTPDFAMIYAFLGSMFDPVCHMINHVDVMHQMTPVDRETATLILANCVHNLGAAEFAEELLELLRPPVMHPGRSSAGYRGMLPNGQ